MKLRRPRVARSRFPLLAAGLAAAVLAAAPAAGQAGLSHIENAVPVPQGMLRLGATPSWARWDSRFTGSGNETEPLGAALSAEQLGTAEIPALTTLESALRNLTGDPAFRLSLGYASAYTSVRAVVTPISLEYGVTRWFSLGVTVPIVQRHRELVLDLAAAGDSAGNVGPTAAGIDAQVYAQAAQLAGEIDAATMALLQRISECAAQPATPGCEAVNADPSGAAAAAAEGTRVAASVRYVYGTSASNPGIGLVPLTGFGGAIAQRLQALNASYATYLGGTPIPTQTPPRGAAGAVAAGDLRALGRRGAAGIGPDSLGRLSTIGIGDVEVGARLLLWDTRPARLLRDTTSRDGARLRVLVGAIARFGTGEPAVEGEIFSVGAGDGQHDAEGSIAIDMETGTRIGATVVGRYTAQFGEVDATRMPDDRGNLSPFGPSGVGTRKLGNVLALDVSPRVWLAPSLYVAGHYGLLSRADDSYRFPLDPLADPMPPVLAGPPTLPAAATAGGYTEQRAGIGVTYSTVALWERGKVRVPIEVSYSHLETFSGSSALVPRAGRDQIQLRLYYRLLR